MAIGTGSFEIAALDAEQKSVDNDENLAELKIGPDVYTLWRRPSTGQYAMLQLRQSRGETFKAIDRFLSGMLLEPEEVLVEGRVDGDQVPYTERAKAGDRFVGVDFLYDLWDRGRLDEDKLVEMLRAVVEIHTGFPTGSSSGSSRSRRSAGGTSTAASQRAASRRSTSSSGGSPA